MLVSQCPCANPSTPVVVQTIDPANGRCPPACEISASATITIQEPTVIVATTCSRRVTDESGVVPAGVRSASFLNDGSVDGYVNGSLLKAGTSLMFPVLGGNTIYAAINYDATGTTFRIDWTAWGAGSPLCPIADPEE